MQESTVLNNKDKARNHGACAHVLTFAIDAGNTEFTCVKCGHNETVRNFN